MSLKGVNAPMHSPASLCREDAPQVYGDSAVKMEEKKGIKPGPLASMALAGTTALIAVNLTHPIEIIKVRMQTEGKFQAGAFLRNEGAMALFKGIQAAWLREISYTSVKLGGYGPIKTALGADQEDSGFAIKFLAGSVAGGAGSLCGNPFDVMKTMMMADAKNKTPLPELMGRMYREQGVLGFYRGLEANIMRACVLNGTKMACYDTIKGHVVEATGWTRKDPRCQFTAAAGAGFFMTCTVAPFDMLRTRLMNQPTDKKIYNGFVDATVKIFRNEGPLAFYRGFLPIWGRFAPQATLQLIIFEKILGAAGYSSL
mmetsp:Transcript_25619/g.59735  ORF Transcript_25619/g.59735 Transcript_25619/m.59735 type:complete len:314 (+) Transcript_25619:152-1093(+)|eukprot:CAMPEP_0182558178 /NCGR_PEP_ID=MMETSP1324-20130603/1829_1 /TAXON_ID=236786 /ORGANISM="Florenciella sp., Strain RCC1587" /LENGTH=313 /DNA_ID=CAMNT_0024770345 /DNA_START=125 /DNA_END=1066 /DNA_ORIENTATION=+